MCGVLQVKVVLIQEAEMQKIAKSILSIDRASALAIKKDTPIGQHKQLCDLLDSNGRVLNHFKRVDGFKSLAQSKVRLVNVIRSH
mmetsp:Transcript_19372/g.21547  ORF Transcript_19372/g.21547 Transcript_19372/m.21547 type:complete len:85 (+) Transcript_19372:323-577(+)